MGMIWSRRPLVWFAAAFGFGIWLGQYTWKDSALIWCFAVLFVVFSTVLYIVKEKHLLFQPIIGILIIFSAVLLGMISYQLSAGSVEVIPDEWKDSTEKIKGKIADVPVREENRAAFVLSKVSINTGNGWRPLKGKMLVSMYPAYGEDIIKTKYMIGQTLTFQGKTLLPQAQRNDFGFDYRAYLLRQGIVLTASAVDKEIAFSRDKKDRSLYGIIVNSREFMVKTIDQWVGGEEGDVLQGILLGSTDKIRSDIKEQFSITGVSHILAISGLHVGYIVLFLSVILSVFHLSPKLSFWFISVVLFLYALLTGLSPSVIRASVMACIILGGHSLGRKTDSLTSVACAFIALLFFHPLDLFDTGFQMSFSAVIGILFLQGTLEKKLTLLPKWMRDTLTVTLGAQLGILPVVIYYFNQVSVISLVSNIIIIPLFGIVVISGVTTLMLAMIWGPLAYLSLWVVRGLLDFVFIAVSLLSKVPFASFNMATPIPAAVVLYYGILVLLSPYLYWLAKRRLKFIGILSLVIVMMYAGRAVFSFKGLELTFIDVGQGDCCLIVTPERKYYLVDGGGSAHWGQNDGFEVGKDIVVPYLIKRGIFHLNGVILSHGHQDHTGGLLAVLNRLDVGRLYQPVMTSSQDPAYYELIKAARKERIPIDSLSAGQILEMDSHTKLAILYPGNESTAGIDETNPNNNSMVMRLEWGKASFLFTGDIEAEVERYLIDRGIAPAQGIKVSHHGSNTSSTKEWIETLQPQFGIINVGKNNFGHPSPEVLQRFYQKGIPLYRTDKSGMITVRYTKKKYLINTHIP